MDYEVDLTTFRGPLDLLLYLVKHNEVDIIDIPIARITEQYMAYLNLLRLIDVEGVGEFLVMAATLMEIKSRLLLPRAEEAEKEQEDPRLELVKQLIEYRKYKEAAALLEQSAQQRLTRLPRQPVEPPGPRDPAQQALRKVELWDLVSAFGRLMRETAALAPKQIVMDETPIHVHMERIMDRLRGARRLSFREIFIPPWTRGRLVGLFLAVLELIKGKQVYAEQPELFGDIWVCLMAAASEPEEAASLPISG
ncbi:MAG: segregation/condensation protein A [Gemmataceae bacterium]